MHDRTHEFAEHANELRLKVLHNEQYNFTSAFAMQDEKRWRFEFNYDPKDNDSQVTFTYRVGPKTYTIKLQFISYLSFTYPDLVRATEWNIKRNVEVDELLEELKHLPKVHKRDLTILLTKGMK